MVVDKGGGGINPWDSLAGEWGLGVSRRDLPAGGLPGIDVRMWSSQAPGYAPFSLHTILSSLEHAEKADGFFCTAI